MKAALISTLGLMAVWRNLCCYSWFLDEKKIRPLKKQLKTCVVCACATSSDICMQMNIVAIDRTGDRSWRLAWLLGTRHFLKKILQILQMFGKYIIASLYNQAKSHWYVKLSWKKAQELDHLIADAWMQCRYHAKTYTRSSGRSPARLGMDVRNMVKEEKRKSLGYVPLYSNNSNLEKWVVRPRGLLTYVSRDPHRSTRTLPCISHDT